MHLMIYGDETNYEAPHCTTSFVGAIGQCFSNCGPLQAVSEEKELQKLYETVNK
jgi:hypothetical protein